MPELPEETVSRDQRLTDLLSSLQNTPILGRIGQKNFETLSQEYVFMKLYATELEEKLVEAIGVLGTMVPKDAPENDEGQPDHTHEAE